MKDTQILTNNGINFQASFELFGDMETYNDTLNDFLDTVDEKLAEIKKYKLIGDMANYAILVHSLKSDSKYLGFTKLAELAYDHEMASKANNMMHVYDHYDELMQEAAKMVDVVGEYLGKEVKLAAAPKRETIISDKMILVVDDSDIIRNLVEKIFNQEYSVLAAKDGREALNILRDYADNNLFGMFLDLNMPNVNGFTVLEYLKVNGLSAKVPVVVITGEEGTAVFNKLQEYTVADVIKKPFNEATIRGSLAKMSDYRF